jgi:CheY-like chemotaxis protein
MESEFGAGSSFSFTIPISQDAAKVPPAILTSNNPDKIKNILVIENDLHTLSALKFALQSKGYQVLRTNNGVNGIEMAVTEKPDLIILDLMMPGMSGFDVADRLHREQATRQTPILVLTAMDLTADNRARLAEKVWWIAEKGSLSTYKLIRLVESAIG